MYALCPHMGLYSAWDPAQGFRHAKQTLPTELHPQHRKDTFSSPPYTSVLAIFMARLHSWNSDTTVEASAAILEHEATYCEDGSHVPRLKDAFEGYTWAPVS